MFFDLSTALKYASVYYCDLFCRIKIVCADRVDCQLLRDCMLKGNLLFVVWQLKTIFKTYTILFKKSSERFYLNALVFI